MVAYNEESTIDRVVREYCRDVLARLPKGSEFILYLDRPSDMTATISHSLAKKLPIKVIDGKLNLGYAGAMKKVLREAKNDIVFYSDSSGKHSAADFWSLLPYTQKYDIVTGDRRSRSDPPVRQLLTWLQRFLVVVLFHVPFYDYNTGFKIVHRRVLNAVLDECKYTKQSFSTEFMIRAIKKGFSVTNIPVRFTKRIDTHSGTIYKHLPRIVYINTRGMFLLWRELSSHSSQWNA